MLNTDRYNQREKGLVPISTPQGEIMWVHLDLVEGQQVDYYYQQEVQRQSKSFAL